MINVQSSSNERDYNKLVVNNNNDGGVNGCPNFDRKLDLVTDGANLLLKKHMLTQ